jgi:hypothetical protein
LVYVFPYILIDTQRVFIIRIVKIHMRIIVLLVQQVVVIERIEVCCCWLIGVLREKGVRVFRSAENITRGGGSGSVLALLL